MDTAQLWAKQNAHTGDRQRLFTAVAAEIDARTVLYPGSYVDVAPSFVWPNVTYVDVDHRARRFFGDVEGVLQIITDHTGAPVRPVVRFIHGDFTTELDLPVQGFDLMISLYAGPISLHCTEHLRVGGYLLVNSSHGDAALASIDPRYELDGVVISRAGDYRVSRHELDSYLIPRKPVEITVDSILNAGRGIVYTKSPFAYMFRRVR